MFRHRLCIQPPAVKLPGMSPLDVGGTEGARPLSLIFPRLVVQQGECCLAWSYDLQHGDYRGHKLHFENLQSCQVTAKQDFLAPGDYYISH
jgi:hypothetical protein